MIVFVVLFSVAIASLLSRSDMPTRCDQYETYNTTDGRYNVSTNQWGADGSGQQCLTVEERDLRAENSISFTVAWNWEDSPEKVHSYPNINLNSHILPIPLGNVGTCNIDASWSMTPGPEPENDTNEYKLDEIGAIANVALDFFLDPDRTRAKSTTKPRYEIMIWFTSYGGIKPIGYVDNKDVPSLEVEGLEFKLYMGPNDNGQYVYTWLASENVTEFCGDVSPLFGTETFHVQSGEQVTFAAKSVLLDIEYGMPKPSSASSSRSRSAVQAVLSALCFCFTSLAILL